ncbi:sulfate transporter CysZ [Carnimonas bestiolae]|uniref:sulfate transporter CysZ n=1 Tax=Carnimonas bestiolae TaxID=3402172 RepID=UPI003F4A9D90
MAIAYWIHVRHSGCGARQRQSLPLVTVKGCAGMLDGFSSLGEGIRLVLKPGLRRYVIVPVIIILLLYAGMIALLATLFSGWLEHWMNAVPSWLQWLDFLLLPLFVLALIVPALYTFTVMVNLLASPFYGFLVEAVERHLGEPPAEDSRSLWRQSLDGVIRELQKLRHVVPRMLVLLILGFVPGINVITPFLWLVFSAWSLAAEYLDYTMDAHGVSVARMRELLQAKRFRTLSFGGAVSVLIWIPVVNLFVMPGAVAAGVILWRDHYRLLNETLPGKAVEHHH